MDLLDKSSKGASTLSKQHSRDKYLLAANYDGHVTQVDTCQEDVVTKPERWKNAPTHIESVIVLGPVQNKAGLFSEKRLKSWFWLKNVGGDRRHSRHWKPKTLRAPVLVGLIAISLLMITVLELLSYKSSRDGNKNGALVVAVNTASIPMTVHFVYLYLPTILIICYSMTWSWIDLDAKRLEPWFQLSNPEGATAKDSLLLQYPFDFLPFVPLRAFRRRHWGVFFSGTIMLMVFWLITPLQSAIFNSGTVVRSIPTSMVISASLIPIEAQSASLNANFLNTAYAVSWLNQILPPFTRKDFATLPFEPESPLKHTLPNAQWTANSTAYSTSLTCTPANMSVNARSEYTFDNGRGCIVPGIVLPSALSFGSYVLNYIGYYNDPHVDWALGNPKCPEQFSNNFLAVWATDGSRDRPGVFGNLTALFCETQYNVQGLTVTVNVSSSSIVSSTPIIEIEGEKLIARVQDIFNTTAFEYLLATGVTPTTTASNLPDTVVLEQYPRLKDYNLTWPVSNMVGFAVALSQGTVEDLSAPEALHLAFEKAHQLLFTAAFARLAVPLDEETRVPRSVQTGFIHDTPSAIIFVRTIAIVVEVALGLVVLLTFFLLFHAHRRPSNLICDPASIGDIMRITNEGDAIISALRGAESFEDSNLGCLLSEQKFFLVDGGKEIISLSPHSVSRDRSCIETTTSSSLEGREEILTTFQPRELSLTTGACFITIVTVAIGVLAYIYSYDLKFDGLPLPSTNIILLSIIENYIPTAFATFLEPIWVILNRLLCVLKPFDELRKGDSRVSKSLALKYTSLPPQFVLWRALRAGHILLAGICAVAVSTNLLAVSLSTLLNQGSKSSILSATSSPQLLPQFNGIPITGGNLPTITYSDHFYVLMSKLTENTTLPKWTDYSNFHLPFDLDVPHATPNIAAHPVYKGFEGSTISIGATTTCNALSPTTGNNTVQFVLGKDALSANFSTSHILPNGTLIKCYPFASNDTKETTGVPGSFPTGAVAAEVVQIMHPPEGVDDSGFCGSLLVMGWIRGIGTASKPLGNSTTPVTSLADAAFTFVACTQKLRMAPFDVVVDLDGHIISSSQRGDNIDITTSNFAGNMTESALFHQTGALIAPVTGNDFLWHNDSFNSDWMNALIGMTLGSAQLFDPSSPVPDAEEIAPLVEKVYGQLFAILLALSPTSFSTSQSPPALPIQVLVTETRIFVSPSMFVLSLTILSLQLLVAILYYTHRPKRFLPRMPTSIASLVAYFAASRALEDFSASVSDTPREEHTYAYGRFVGTDGRTHVGIERQRYVVPLKSRNPEVRRRRRTGLAGLLRRASGKGDEGEVKSWI